MADPLFLVALGLFLAGAFLGGALGIPVGYAMGYRHGRAKRK